MILVIFIVAAWAVILTPSLLRRRSRTVGEIGSISHFHRQLRVLEHSAPEPIVAPAYRLRSFGGGSSSQQFPDVASVPVLSVVGASELPRPALAFLGEDPEETVEPSDGLGAASSELPNDGSRALPSPLRSNRPVGTDHRSRVLRRRRDTLSMLVVAVVVTALVGFIPGASDVWILTALCGIALGAYVAMLVRLRMMAEERERKLHYLTPRDSDGGGAIGPEIPVYMSGRYAHPSNQALAAHS
jgi:hypothetical protein